MKPIQVAVIDDEPVARKRIIDLLDQVEQFQVCAECANGVEAKQVIEGDGVDLIFVDVQMPQMDGITLVKSLSPSNRPLIIFVTAYDEFAIDAFNLFAVDYLLKPFSKERFKKTLSRLVLLNENVRALQKNQVDGLISAFSDNSDDRAGVKRISVKLGNRFYFVPIDQVEYISASGSYLEVFANNRFHVIRETMTKILNKLPSNFVRIHKSTIVNIEFVVELISIGYGDYELKMKDNNVFRISDTYKKVLLEKLEF